MTSPENTPRTNLISNPSFKTNTTGWSGTGSATLARITTDYVFGGACLEVTKSNTTNSGAVLSSRVAVTASLSYATSAYVKVPTGEQASSVRIKVDWYTALSGGSLISSSLSELAVMDPGSDWVRIGEVATAPVTAVAALVSVIQPTAGTVSKKFLVDGVLFEQASQVNLYTDDFTQGYETTTVNKALTPLPPPVFSGMKLKADVQLGELVLNTIDENGVVWVVTDIKGWWGHPEPEMKDVPRGWGDGSYDVRGRWAARDLTLEGVFLPPDVSYVPAARNKLIEATSLVYTNAWLYVDEVPTKASKVRLSGRPDIETVNPRGRTEFSIGLRAPDPIKYGWNWERTDGYYAQDIACANASTSHDGTGTVTNSGNTDVHVILRVTGPLTGPATISNMTNGQELGITQALRAATSRTVTTKARSAGGVVTLTTSATHGFLVGDQVTVAITDSTFNGTFTITDTPSTTTFTYSQTGSTVSSSAASGSASIPVDVLEIDTYTLEVSFNDSTDATRSMLDTFVDWIVLTSGANTLKFVDSGNANSSASMTVYYRPGWIG